MIFPIGETEHPGNLLLGVSLLFHEKTNCQVTFEFESLWTTNVQTPLLPPESPPLWKINTSSIFGSCLLFSPAGPIRLVSYQAAFEPVLFSTLPTRIIYLLMYTSFVFHQPLFP